MGKTPKPVPTVGTATAAEIYQAVGVAISFWEASEDELMGLFSLLCKEREPTAFDMYVASPRSRRGDMLRDALGRYERRIGTEKAKEVRLILKELDKLAAMRNEIAHGHCSQVSRTENNIKTMSGHYLMPSLNEGGWHERSYRYAHTAETMNEFTVAVRAQRAKIMDIKTEVVVAEQEARKSMSEEDMRRHDFMRQAVMNYYTPYDVPPFIRFDFGE